MKPITEKEREEFLKHKAVVDNLKNRDFKSYPIAPFLFEMETSLREVEGKDYEVDLIVDEVVKRIHERRLAIENDIINEEGEDNASK